MQISAGQLLVNQALPEDLQRYDRALVGDDLETVLAEIGHRDPELYREVSAKLMHIGREHAYLNGTTIKLDDLSQGVGVRKSLMPEIRKAEAAIDADHTLSPDERRHRRGVLYDDIQERLVKLTLDNAVSTGNSLGLQVVSKSRGNPLQLASVLSTPGAFRDNAGKSLGAFVDRSYSEGLRPHEYYMASFGARRGVISTKFCLAETTPVLMADYSVKMLRDVVVGDRVFSVDDNFNKVVTIVTGVSVNGIRHCHEFVFRSGRSQTDMLGVIATADHNVMLTTMRSRDLVTEMLPLRRAIAGRTSVKLAGPAVEGGDVEPFSALIGALLGDGNVTQHNGLLYASDPKLVSFLNTTLNGTGVELKHNADMESGVKRYLATAGTVGSGNYVGNPLLARLRELGVMGVAAPEKRIPESVFAWDMRSCAMLAQGLLETDGCVTQVTSSQKRKYVMVSFYVTSAALAHGLKRLLALRLGVDSGAVAVRRVKGNKSTFHNNGVARTVTRNHDLYGFSINGRQGLERLSALWVGTGKKAALLRQLLSAQVSLYENVKGNCLVAKLDGGDVETMDLEVAHPSHTFVLANGMIVSNSTRDAGDLGKQMNVVASGLRVTEEDCGTINGLPVDGDDADNAGALLANPSGGYKRNAAVDSKFIKSMSGKGAQILVRSPMTCQSKTGVCKMCAGLRETGRLPELGDAIGLKSTSALSERIAQGALNTKHSGGQKGKDSQYSGFPYIDQLAQMPESFNDGATVASTDGKIDRIEPAAQGGTNIFIGDSVHYVLPQLETNVKVGDEVEAGDQLSSGLMNPADVVKYKGLGEGRRYFAERFTKSFKDSGLKAIRRNVEVLSRAFMNNVEITNPEGVGDYLPGDVVRYSALESSYVPHPTSKRLPAVEAHGQYLEAPALHYTIGTRVTKKLTDQLSRHGVDQVIVNPEEPDFAATTVRMQTAGDTEPDWMAKLQGTYLMKNLRQNAQLGATSNIHGTHPAPAIAYGAELGKSPTSPVTF